MEFQLTISAFGSMYGNNDSSEVYTNRPWAVKVKRPEFIKGDGWSSHQMTIEINTELLGPDGWVAQVVSVSNCIPGYRQRFTRQETLVGKAPVLALRDAENAWIDSHHQDAWEWLQSRCTTTRMTRTLEYAGMYDDLRAWRGFMSRAGVENPASHPLGDDANETVVIIADLLGWQPKKPRPVETEFVERRALYHKVYVPEQYYRR